MRLLDYSKLRLEAFLEQASTLSESEFPYEDSRKALSLVQSLFKERLAVLRRFDAASSAQVVRQECQVALRDLFRYLPLLGFILRSTNVRNGFEAFAPIRRLARRLLAQAEGGGDQGNIHLLLSSEWDYSPFVYDAVEGLPGFLMIGLPAPESSNPLLLPLAGHELGHCLWRSKGLRARFEPEAKKAVIEKIRGRWAKYQELFNSGSSPDDLTSSLYELQNWAPASAWAVFQAEETFCDFVGTALFGTSFVHAFTYLLSPAFGRRAVTYPSLLTRAENLVWAIGKLGGDVPESVDEFFEEESASHLGRRDLFRLEIADEALQLLRGNLFEQAARFVADADFTQPAQDKVEEVFQSFANVKPSEGAGGVVEVLSGAWRAFHDEELWSEFPQVQEKKEIVLSELTLKSLEILEYEHLVEGTQ